METEHKTFGRVKSTFAKLQDKIQNKVEDIQETVQTKFGDKLTGKFTSHVHESTEVTPEEEIKQDDEEDEEAKEIVFKIDGPKNDKGPTIKVIYDKQMSRSACDLNVVNEFLAHESLHSSYIESCNPEYASDDERSHQSRPRTSSLPPDGVLDGPTDLLQPGDFLERLGNRFPKLKEQGDRVQRYFQRNSRLSDVNKRLKAQIWSSVVTIVLVEAKNLPAMDLNTGSSDPYVKFRLGNEKYKSKVIWKSLHPSWLEQFDLHLYDDQEQLLEVTLWDKDKQSKDDFLGRCMIDLSMLEREKTHTLWQDLEDGNGQIFLLLTISGTTQSETITDLTTFQENYREREMIERRYIWYRLRESGSSGVGWLSVKVFGAKGLASADLGGKSDPFCVLELGNARLQTHTEYKTLSPNWMKIFTFTIKDMTSILEVTVYDEDHDHKVEFLGRLMVPLLQIQNGEKRWYALKDKKMRARAKGNHPQILLEMFAVWNPVKAAIRAINPREEKYMQQEAKFKRQLFIRNVMRLKVIILWFIEVGKILQNCFEWESRIASFFGLMAWLVFCYQFDPWMAPFLLLVWFARNWLIYWLTGGNPLLQTVDDEDILAEEDDDDPEADKEEKKSLKERLQAIQEVTQTVQNAIGYVASLGEGVKNLVNFTVPYLSYLAIIMLFGASLVLYLIPVRYLLMAWGVNKFTRKILRPHTIPNNEVLDLLSRVPDDEILLDCRELKTHLNNEARRDARKKHKAA